jgi:hypothetical protein
MPLILPILGFLLLTSGTSAPEQEAKDLERIQKLIWRLESGDIEQRKLAERELIDVGEPAIELLKRAGLGASPEAQARLDRVLRWVSPEWMIDPAATVKSWYEPLLRQQDPDFTVRSVSDITWQETEMAPVRRLFKLYQYSTTFQGRSSGGRILVNRAGECTLWNGQLEDIRRLLDACRLKAVGEKEMDQIGRICRIIRGAPPLIFRDNPRFLLESERLEAERIEIKNRDFIYHEHSLVLFGGRAGFYEEDLVYHFGEDGRLETMNSTGISPEDFKAHHKKEDFLAEVDPWLRLWGYVDVETRDDVRKRQKDKERTPPRHDRP